MKPKISIITLLVDDLERSLTFYRDGLGLPPEKPDPLADGGDHIVIPLEDELWLVLFLRAALEQQLGQGAVRRSGDGSILSYNASSTDEVDEIMTRAVAAGGTAAATASEQSWGGYAGYFRDPDGHLWEIVGGLE